jgi:DNA-binding transcriptional regulator YiaG
MKKPVIDGNWVKAKRAKLGMNQSEFWSELGVTQSGGSRYESGRAIPTPVRKLVFLRYVEGLTPKQLAALRKA